MIYHYLQVALRNLKRQKGYSFINIFGLSLGLAICMFILLYIRYELSFDSHHRNSGRIYRIGHSVEGDTFSDQYGGIAPIFAGLVKETLPQIEHVTWTWMHNVDSQVECEDAVFKEECRNVMFVDEEFLSIFSLNFLYGNPAAAFKNPHSALITVGAAEKYFNTDNALDRTINVDSVDYRITGIVEDPPGNSIFQYKILKSWNVLEDPLSPSKQSTGFDGFYQTFVKLHPGADTAVLERHIRDIVVERNKDYLESANADVVATLQPLRTIHFQPDIQFSLPSPGNILYIYLFSCVALFCLAITSINFVNLSTARSVIRAGEVGIRKTVGAQRRQLIAQFMGESFLNVAISFFAALTLVNILIPQFNTLTKLKVE